MSTLLLVDATYLCHRARHSIGPLNYGGCPTGTIFGFLRDINKLRDVYSPNIVAFAFDHGGIGKRGELLPTYKQSRRSRNLSDEEKSDLQDFREQVKRLRSDILPSMGFRNIFCKKGFEADDILAVLADDVDLDDHATIVTADKDLWQCLKSNVSWYNPRSGVTITDIAFRNMWGIRPSQWADVKALAGCSTDDVVGVRGIGEITAAKWISGNLKAGSKKYEIIMDNLGVMNKNLPLVRLPFPGIKAPRLRTDKVTERKKRKIEQELGIRPVRKSLPSTTKGFDV